MSYTYAFVCSRLLHLCALDFCIRVQPTFIFAMPVSPWKWMSRKYCSVLILFHCIPNSLLDHGLIFDWKCRKSIIFYTELFDHHWTNSLEQILSSTRVRTAGVWLDQSWWGWPCLFSLEVFKITLFNSFLEHQVRRDNNIMLLMTKGFLVTYFTLDTLCTPFEEHCCTVPWEHSDTGFVVPEIL